MIASTLLDFGCGLLISGAFHKGRVEQLAELGPRTTLQKAGLILSLVGPEKSN